MPVGTSTGEVYEDQFDFQTKSPLATNNLSQEWPVSPNYAVTDAWNKAKAYGSPEDVPNMERMDDESFSESARKAKKPEPVINPKDLISQLGAVPKAGQTLPVPVTSPDQINKSVLDFLTPESLKPMAPEETERRLRAFQEAKPGEKVPELENPAQSSIFAGATDALGMLPVGGAGASSKAMFLGIQGARRLLGADVLNRTLTRAERIMEGGLDKVTAHELSMKTGITIGADDLLRYEIPNHRSEIIEKNLIPGPNNTLSPKMDTKVEDVLHHPELFKAYPQLAKIPVYPLAPEYKGKYLGVHTSSGIQLDDMNPDKLRDVLLHELQHAIQRREGFAYGGMLKTPEAKGGVITEEDIRKSEKDYAHLAGEVEARNVVTRRDLTILHRARILPESTEDVARSEQIIQR